MKTSMAAARFLGAERIEITERPVPEPGPDEVLLEVDSCALCGTDRGAFFNGSDVVPGHEISGTVRAVGSNVDTSLIGSPQLVYLVKSCGVCACCQIGRTNMCLDKQAMYGFNADGGFAEFTVVAAKCCLPVPSGIELGDATALLDLLGTSAHAFRRVGRPPGRVAVIGCGPIGIGAISVALAMGAEMIYAIDVSPYRLELAARLGAHIVDARQGSPVPRCLTLVPDGFDVVIEAAGSSTTQSQAIELAAAGGTVAFVAHNHDLIAVDTLHQLIQFEKTLLGSEYFPIGEYESNVELLGSDEIDTGKLITHRFPLHQIAEAFATFMSGRSGKVLVQP